MTAGAVAGCGVAALEHEGWDYAVDGCGEVGGERGAVGAEEPEIGAGGGGFGGEEGDGDAGGGGGADGEVEVDVGCHFGGGTWCDGRMVWRMMRGGRTRSRLGWTLGTGAVWNVQKTTTKIGAFNTLELYGDVNRAVAS